MESFVARPVDGKAMVNALVAEVKKSPDTKQLLKDAQVAQRAEGEPGIKVYIASNEVMDGYEGEFYCSGKYSGRLRIREDLSWTDKLCTFIFELANFAQAQRFRDLEERMWGDSPLSRDAYILESETIENESMRIHHRVVQQGIKKLLWEPQIDCYPDVEGLSDEQLNAETSDEHKAFFGRQWDAIMEHRAAESE